MQKGILMDKRGGMNKECSFCDGSGMIYDVIHNSSGQDTRTPWPGRTANGIPQKAWVTCPIQRCVNGLIKKETCCNERQTV